VPVEHHWDRIIFLEQTCRKAGLALDAWKEALVESFTAEIFGDQDLSR
jgi:AMMECR1 domain-containing protein